MDVSLLWVAIKYEIVKILVLLLPLLLQGYMKVFFCLTNVIKLFLLGQLVNFHILCPA